MLLDVVVVMDLGLFVVAFEINLLEFYNKISIKLDFTVEEHCKLVNCEDCLGFLECS